ncbi:uncharacterized protein LOC115887017 [Sitophilus oryzae]|uniref:Uncharacterized protein LOC115887017 n=1 Tax=Sitophilus oryzae TaxID=7048 RepID=A0A6J2YFU4_SITOR|nr:uncharacterized protein LOC115887017 [Sitophilus oryzae]
MAGHKISAFDRARFIALHEEGLSRHQIADRLNLVRSIVSRIIQRYMDTGNVRSRPRLGRPRITTERQNRYLAQFARRNRIGLISDDYRQRVWREAGRQHRLNTALAVAPYQGGTEMFWGGIMYNRRTELIHIPEVMNAHLYVETVIRPIIYPLREEIGNNFILMDDNARPHRARIVQVALNEGK